MKTLIKSRLGVILFLALALIWQNTHAQGDQLFTHGLGSEKFPYLIENVSDLLLLAQLVNDGNTEYNNRYLYYRLETNINLSSYGAGYNGGKGWIPIGHSDTHPFFANFDGNNKTISNLYINNPAQGAGGYNHTGFFGWLNGGAVKNLTVSEANITGYGNVGGIAGSVSFNSSISKAGDITNCIFSGTVAGGAKVGGIAGANNDGRIINSYATGDVSGTDYAGGIAGYSYAGTIRDCAALNQNVSASGAGGNVGRIAWVQPGAVATMLSGNIAFDEMTVLSNGTPKTITNSDREMDGANRSAINLRYISGFPSGFHVSPWVFSPGKLPGLGASLEKPTYLTAMLVTLTVNRNGEAWIRPDKTFTLKFNGDETIEHPMTRTPNSNLYTTAVKRSGVWKIYDGETFTGLTITVNNVEGSGVINYLTVNYTVRDVGMTGVSTISATYGGQPITGGDLVVAGQTLVITATKAGAQTCAYAWIGAGTSGQTTESITLPFLENSVNAFCTVTSTYAVTFDVVNANGTLTATVDGVPISSGALALYGKDVVYTATPNPGYSVKEWKHNGATVNGALPTYRIYNLAAAQNVTVEFEYVEYLVQYSVEGINGVLVAAVDGAGISSGTMVEKDKTIEFAADPVSGYRVEEWKVNGIPVTGNKTNNYTLQSIDAPSEVTVAFELITHSITFEIAGGNGTFTATDNNGSIDSGVKLLPGKTVVFTATPNTNYRIKEWKDNGITVNGADETYTITDLNDNHHVTVTFELIPYEVTFSVEGGNGSLVAEVEDVAISSGAQVPHGSTVVFTAKPNIGYIVKEWIVNGVATEETGETCTVTNLTEPITVTVEYLYVAHTITYSEKSGNGSLTAVVGISVISSGALVPHGETIKFTANPEYGNRVKAWYFNGTEVPDNKTGMYTLIITDDVTVTVEFEIATYKVTFSDLNGNGTLAAEVDEVPITSNTQVEHGKKVVFTADPELNYRVKGWKVNNNTVNGTNLTYTVNSITTEYDVTVEFEPVTYAVTFSVTGGNGSISATVDGAPISSIAQVPHGKTVEFTATPNSNYKVKEWKVKGATVPGVTTNSYSLPTVTEATTVTVTFEPITHEISFSAGGNGTLSATVNGAPIVNGALVQQGRSVVFTATPASEYRVKRWMNGTTEVTGNQTNSYTHLVTAEATVTVEFERDEFVISFDVTGSAGGDITATVGGTPISSGDPVLRGKSVVFTATPFGCNRISEWKDNNITVNGTNTSYLMTNITASHNITVAFEEVLCIQVTFNVVDGMSDNGTLTATVDGKPITSGADVQQGKNVVFTATPDEGYSVQAWYLNDDEVSGNTSNIYTLTGLAAASTVTVAFVDRPPTHHAVSFSVVNGIGGTIKATVDDVEITSPESVAVGKNVLFTATPATGYSLKEWKDNGATVTGSTSYEISNLTAPHSVTVEFVINTYTVTFGAAGNIGGKVNATVEGSAITSGNTVQHGKDVVFTAVADEGYQLTEWRLGGATVGDKSNSYQITDLSVAATVTVVFEKIAFPLTFNVEGADYGSLVVTAGGTPVMSPTTVEHGKTVTFTATPQSVNCRVKEWIDNGEVVNGSNTDYTITSYTSEHTVTVEFEPITFPVTFYEMNSNGTLTAKVNGVNINSGDMVQQGSNIVFTADPAPGFKVTEWKVNGSTESGTNGTFTITGIMQEYTVTVEFEPVTYPVTFGKTGNGSLTATVDGMGIKSGDQVQYGKEIVFLASPDNGYKVKEWKLDEQPVSGTANSYTLQNLSKATNVTVEFTDNILLLTYSVDGGNGNLTAKVKGEDIASNQKIDYGESVVLKAEPQVNYRIKRWTDNEVEVNGTNETYTINNFSTAHDVVVAFEPIVYSVTFSSSSYGELTAKVNGAGITSGTMIQQGQVVEFTATPDANCRIKGWKDNGVTISVTGNTHTIPLNKALNITVDFEPITFPVQFNVVSGNGSLSATVDGSGITSGTPVQQGKEIVFRATPAGGYKVKEWKVNGSVLPDHLSTKLTLSSLSEATSVTVEFEDNILKLTYDVNGGNGNIIATIDGNPFESGELVDYGKSVVFEATPDGGYRIKEWKDNGDTVNGTHSQYTIPNFTTEHIVKVEFESITFPVTFNVVNGNGALGATVNGDDIISVAQVQQGKSVEFTAVPITGYRVKEWKLNDMVVSGNKTNSYTSPDVTAAMSVTVEFERATYAVTFEVVNGNGMLAASVGGIVSISSGTLVPHGRNIIFTASPDDEYRVKEWRLNGDVVPDITTNSYTLSLTATTSVEVEFEMIPLTIVTSGLPDGIAGMSYSQNLFVISETPVTWSIASGSLPDGLDLSDDGLIFGMPMKAGTFTFTVKATNRLGSDVKVLAFTIEKGSGAAVATPTMYSKTLNSITLNAIPEPYDQTVEYAISTASNAKVESLSWQDGLTFIGLTENTTYYVYARSKDNDNYFAGMPSVSEAIITDGSATSSGEDQYETPLKVFVKGGRLYVRGLVEDQLWSVYSTSGMLVYRGIATSDEMDILLNAQGVFIVQSGDRTVKFACYGQ